MQLDAISFVWGGFFAAVVLLVVGGLAVFAQSHHRVALQSVVTALLTALFVVSYLGWLPGSDRFEQLRLVSVAGIVTAIMLGLLLLVDLGLLRERATRAIVLRATALVTAAAVSLSWLVSPRQAVTLASLIAAGVALVSLVVSVRSALRGDDVAWIAASSLVFALTLVAGATLIALDRAGVPWPVHAISAVAGIGFLTAVGAMLWLRYSFLIEMREVLAQGPRYDPITRMRSSHAVAQMAVQAFGRHREPDRPVVLIAVSIGNLYALENLHGRAALNHALFVCASRLRRCAPADMDMGRLADDAFLLVSRNARDAERLMQLGRRLAKQLTRPVTLHTTPSAEAPGDEGTEWAAQVGVGLLATSARSQPSAMVSKVRDMSRTAWSFDSRVAWLDQGSDSIAELPVLDSAR
ncbi:GGDEF domain-containing protein [Ramlibacter sp. RBP-2]|uniref:GGDEF domain-containing protein n=1 Tax=Ramlibacter lithotrophicus TaxID=2606681 RepID=A0A7X6I4X3_9BURK|nr:GGDEF domain-containing protein [Ramlibacter lithotrophicus]NKE64733.1 GGDEF domain-containing protein [Ramlibacter lithotrophicus]